MTFCQALGVLSCYAARCVPCCAAMIVRCVKVTLVMHRVVGSANGVCLVFIYFCVACGAANAGEGLLQDELSAVRRDFRASASVISSISVEYEVRGYDGRRYPPGTFARKVVKAMTPCYLYLDLAHGHDGRSWKADPYRQAAYVTESKNYAVRPISRMYFWEAMSSDQQLPAALSGESFFWATGIWPMHGRKGPLHSGLPIVLGELANEERLEVVSGGRQVINGRSCMALKIDVKQNLWVDPERGHCIIMREYLEPDTGAMSMRYECADQREVAAGVWLPLRIDVTYLGQVDDGRLRINVLEINKLNREAFHYEPMPGEVESRFVNGEWTKKQIRPGGLDHLDQMVEWVSQIRGLLNRHLPYNVGLTRVVASPLMFAAVLVFISEVIYGNIIVHPSRSAVVHCDAKCIE